MGDALEIPDDMPPMPGKAAFPGTACDEFVMSMCKECSERGPWTLTIRDDSGRITQYDMWDVHHLVQTGHKEFHHFTLSRANKYIV